MSISSVTFVSFNVGCACSYFRSVRVPLFSKFCRFWRFSFAKISAFSFIFSLFLPFSPNFMLFFLVFCLWPITPLLFWNIKRSEILCLCYFFKNILFNSYRRTVNLYIQVGRYFSRLLIVRVQLLGIVCGLKTKFDIS